MSNSLATVHPELIVEWSDRNLPLTPDSVTFGSNKKVWWKGACGHEWETSIKARSSGEKCPICSGARVIEGINDLNTLKPELASEWSEENEIKPTEVSIGSHKKVIWKCKLGHEWIATVKSRTINRTSSRTAPITKCLQDLMTLQPCSRKLQTSGLIRMKRSPPKLWLLQTARLGGSARPAVMSGTHLSPHAQAAVNAPVAVAIHLLKEKMT